MIFLLKIDDISSSIEICIDYISILMNSNMVKLEKYVTEFIISSSTRYAKKTFAFNKDPVI